MISEGASAETRESESRNAGLLLSSVCTDVRYGTGYVGTLVPGPWEVGMSRA